MTKMEAVWQAFINGVPTQKSIAAFLLDHPEHPLASAIQKMKLLTAKIELLTISPLVAEFKQAVLEFKQLSYPKFVE